jgi:NAD(P)-dependent dehydrogenase (short-subunit alcohol dehydrogenase family)
MNQFAGKTAVISGGGEGIGLSIAKALGEQQMNIVLADIDAGNLRKASAELEQAGVPVLAVTLDVAEEAQWQEVARQALDRFGSIHMLINNAGVGGESGSIENQNAQSWEWTVNVNLMGVVFGAKVLVPLIKEHGDGGWLVNVASMAGMGGVPYGATVSPYRYCAPRLYKLEFMIRKGIDRPAISPMDLSRPIELNRLIKAVCWERLRRRYKTESMLR